MVLNPSAPDCSPSPGLRSAPSSRSVPLSSASSSKICKGSSKKRLMTPASSRCCQGILEFGSLCQLASCPQEPIFSRRKKRRSSAGRALPVMQQSDDPRRRSASTQRMQQSQMPRAPPALPPSPPSQTEDLPPPPPIPDWLKQQAYQAGLFSLLESLWQASACGGFGIHACSQPDSTEHGRTKACL